VAVGGLCVPLLCGACLTPPPPWCPWCRVSPHYHATPFPPQIAKAARSDRHYSTASSALLHASRLGCPAAQIETAEMMHDQGQVRAAAAWPRCAHGLLSCGVYGSVPVCAGVCWGVSAA